MKKIFGLLFFIVLILPNSVLAQTNLSNFNIPQEIIDLNPKFPQPGEAVTANLNLVGDNYYGASITWLFNGEEVENSTNKKSISFVVGENGSVQKIKIILNKVDGSTQIEEKIIRPLYLDIIIEPQTRVPDFYLGRSLPSVGSLVNATAIINGDQFSSNNLVYAWKLNNQAIEGGSLRSGKKVSFTVPLGNYFTLSLSISDLNGNILAQRSVGVASVKPRVVFYENNLLYGLNHKPLTNNYYLVGDTLAIKAEPYHLDSRLYNNPNFYQWKTDGVTNQNNLSNPYEITIQRVADFGASTLDFEIRDQKQLLQGAEGSVKINF